MEVSAKEVLTFFLLIMLNGLYSAYGYFINYQMAYMKLAYPEYSKPFMLATIFFLDFGIVGANYVINDVLNRIGIFGMIRLGGMIAMIASGIFMYFQNMVMVCFGFLLGGVAHQIYTFSALFYLGSKCKKDLVKNTGYVFTGYSVSYIVWGMIANQVVNPNNFGETVKVIVTFYLMVC